MVDVEAIRKYLTVSLSPAAASTKVRIPQTLHRRRQIQFKSTAISGCGLASSPRFTERGVALPFLVLVLFVIVIICFMAVHYVLNVEKQVRENKVVVAMTQLMQSASDSQSAFEAAALIARLQGLGDVLPQDAPHTLASTHATVDLDFDGTVRPPVTKVTLRGNYDLLNSFGGVLSSQEHHIELTGTSETALVISAFDKSYSMHGPDRGDALDNLLTTFGVPLDPQRMNPNPAARSLCSPIGTDDMWQCRRYASLLPGYSLGMRALPADSSWAVALNNDFYIGALGYPTSYLPPDGLPPVAGGPRKLVCTWPGSSENEPGYRIALPGPDPTALPGTPQRFGTVQNCFTNSSGPVSPQHYCSDITDQMLCVTPWRFLVNDDPMLGFFTQHEYNVCAARWGGAPPSPEIHGPGCGTLFGYLLSGFSDFWNAYKTIVQWFAIEVDRFAIQTFSVISAATPGGNFTVGAEKANGHFILWDGTGGYDPAHRGLGLMTVDYLNKPPALLNPGQETYVHRKIGGEVVMKNLNHNIGPVRRLLMRQAHDSSYTWFRPNNAAYQAIINPQNGLSPVPHWGVPPNQYGQYNSYGLSAFNFGFHPSNGLNSFFSWASWGDTFPDPASREDTFFPAPREANFYEGYPITPPQLQNWGFGLPPLLAFDPVSGAQTGGMFVNALQQNRPFEIFSQLSPSSGGTDLGGAMEGILAACQRHLDPAQGGSPTNRCAAVIATDGEPELSACRQQIVTQWHPAGVCHTEDYTTHANRFFDALDDYLALGEGDHVIFVLHMLPANFTASPNLSHFVGQVQARQSDGALYINLNYSTPSTFPDRLGFALGAILQVLESFTRFG